MKPKKQINLAKLLKAKKNPFLAPFPSPTYSLAENSKRIPYTMLGAMTAAGVNALVTDKLPSGFHLPVHALAAAATTVLPQHAISASTGGAMFYALISESYYSFIKSSLLQSVKSAIK